MSPYEIDILMWYHTRPGDHPQMSNPPPIWRKTMNRFVDDQLLKEVIGKDTAYQITERGNAYCEALCNVPLPIQKWVMP